MKPKVIIILNRLVIGGQAVDTIPLAYYLQEYFNVLILYGEKEADEVEASFLLQQYPNLQVKKIKQLRRTINPITDILAFWFILKEIKNFGADIVHTHGSKSGLIGRWSARILKVSVIVHTFHGHLFHSYFSSTISRLLKLVERLTAKISTHIIALSDLQKFELSDKFKVVNANKITVIPLGIDEKYLKGFDEDKRKNFRQKFGLKENNIAVGIVGRVVPIKNHQLFLEIVENFLADNQYEHLFFFIIGDGEESLNLMKKLDAKGIPYNKKNESRVFFTSWVEDMLWAYYGLDIVMLTSLNEGTPLSIIEAQFCGKPVIATNVGGVKDTFSPNVSGILVDGYNSTDYVNALKKMTENRELLNKMAQEAVIYANKTFSKKAEVEAIKNLYQQKLSVKPQ